MTVRDWVSDGIFGSAISEDATYISASGARTPVVAIRTEVEDLQLADADIAVRGLQLTFKVRKSELPCRPVSGEFIEAEDGKHCIDESVEFNGIDWVIYVVT